jgi:hypothetical protein
MQQVELALKIILDTLYRQRQLIDNKEILNELEVEILKVCAKYDLEAGPYGEVKTRKTKHG